MIVWYCDSLLIVAKCDSLLKEQLASHCCWCGVGSSPRPAPSPLLLRLYHCTVLSRIDLGKLSNLFTQRFCPWEEGRGDCGGGKKITRFFFCFGEAGMQKRSCTSMPHIEQSQVFLLSFLRFMRRRRREHVAITFDPLRFLPLFFLLFVFVFLVQNETWTAAAAAVIYFHLTAAASCIGQRCLPPLPKLICRQ